MNIHDVTALPNLLKIFLENVEQKPGEVKVSTERINRALDGKITVEDLYDKTPSGELKVNNYVLRTHIEQLLITLGIDSEFFSQPNIKNELSERLEKLKREIKSKITSEAEKFGIGDLRSYNLSENLSQAIQKHNQKGDLNRIADKMQWFIESALEMQFEEKSFSHAIVQLEKVDNVLSPYRPPFAKLNITAIGPSLLQKFSREIADWVGYQLSDRRFDVRDALVSLMEKNYLDKDVIRKELANFYISLIEHGWPNEELESFKKFTEVLNWQSVLLQENVDKAQQKATWNSQLVEWHRDVSSMGNTESKLEEFINTIKKFQEYGVTEAEQISVILRTAAFRFTQSVDPAKVVQMVNAFVANTITLDELQPKEPKLDEGTRFKLALLSIPRGEITVAALAEAIQWARKNGQTKELYNNLFEMLLQYTFYKHYENWDHDHMRDLLEVIKQEMPNILVSIPKSKPVYVNGVDVASELRDLQTRVVEFAELQDFQVLAQTLLDKLPMSWNSDHERNTFNVVLDGFLRDELSEKYIKGQRIPVSARKKIQVTRLVESYRSILIPESK